ncbi:MAG: putative porin [Porphyromonadaceae bacterium]|nr:putative porin [Porphyromonadaceae bacterium]
MRRILLFTLLSLSVQYGFAAKKIEIGEPYAWRLSQPLGTPYRIPMDTLIDNFYNSDLPATYSTAYSYTGNLGGASLSKVFFDRPDMPQFIFKAPFDYVINSPEKYTFYNTRIPMTLASYLFGGGQQSKQNDLKAEFSGNVNRRLAVAADIRYLYSRGFYDNQGTNEVTWQAATSYLGDRYQMHALVNSFNLATEENGGLSDIRFITDPDAVASGQGNITTQSYPVYLSDAGNRVKGMDYYLTHRYNLGFYKSEWVDDTTEVRTFTPVTSFIHTIDYTTNMHRFVNESASEDTTSALRFDNQYFRTDGTRDSTKYWSLKNTIGVSLLEGFNRYAKMGISAYATYEVRRFILMGDAIPSSMLTPPTDYSLNTDDHVFSVTQSNKVYTENVIWVGGIISKQQGELLTYTVDGKIGLVGVDAGATDINGEIQTRFPIRKTTVQLRAYGYFKNEEPSFYYRHYVSNHFIWENNFGKIRKFRVGGEFSLPATGTVLNIGVENIQNYVYFDNSCLPCQDTRILQIFSAMVKQKIKWGIFNLNLEAVYQKSSDSKVIPLPDLSAYGQMFLDFRVAKVLQVQFGVDCKYHTSYYAEAFQPATLTFYTQHEQKVGNYPLMNVYANMKMKMVRFYVMYTHFNKGLFGGDDYFIMPNYPYNPAMLQFGLCVNFTN